MLIVFRAMGASPSAGAVTIDFAGDTHLGCAWSIVEFAGVDTGGTNGSAAVVQSNNNREDGDSDQALSVTLASFGAADNRPYAAFAANRNAATTWVPETDYDQLHQVAHASPDHSLMTEWRDDATDTSPSATLAVATLNVAGIALEIKAAGAAAGSVGHRVIGGGWGGRTIGA